MIRRVQEALTMPAWRTRTIRDRQFVVTNKDASTFGHDLILRSCTLTLKCSKRSVVFSGVKAYDCDFIIGKQLKDFQSWCCDYLERCRFSGHLAGHDFGRHSDPFWPQEAGIC